jgi:hypothetical protein
MKSQPNNDPPKPFSLDVINTPISETDVPHTYFAGVATLNIDWICYPLVTKQVNNNTGSAGK